MTNARLTIMCTPEKASSMSRRCWPTAGSWSLSFEATKPFVADRMARTLREAFGQEPICFASRRARTGWGGVMFVAGDLEQARRADRGQPAARHA